MFNLSVSSLRGKIQRIDSSIEERILPKIDRFAKKTNQTRSKLLAEAALEYIVVSHDRAN